MGRDDVEAAYFTLLRARTELDGLRRYEEYLERERQRILRWTSEGAALADTVDRRHRRLLTTADQQLEEVLRDRLALLAEELRQVPNRIVAAEAFVETCDQEHQHLVAGRAPGEQGH